MRLKVRLQGFGDDVEQVILLLSQYKKLILQVNQLLVKSMVRL